MKRILVVLSACVLAGVLALIPQFVSAHPAKPGTQPQIRLLSGSVGPTMTISMSKTKTHAGRYKITIHDNSALHNFHLTGPNGVDKATGVSFSGTVTWRVTLVAGTYKFQCDVHPTTMHGTLKVVSG